MTIRMYRDPAAIPTSVLFALLTVSGTASAQSLAYNIPSEPLSLALRDYGRESGRQIVFTEELVRGHTSQAVKGTYSADVVLGMLLDGTGLVARVRPSGAIMIERKSSGDVAPKSGDSQASERETAGDALQSSQATGGPALGEIIVTAQKFRQRAFDVPISMTVVAGPELQRLGITDLEDLQYYVPGMFMQNNGDSQFITIQGVSNFSGQGALVGTYLDEADVT